MESDPNCEPFSHDQNVINHLPCVFARVLGRRLAICEFARTSALAKTPAKRVLCTQPLARATCAEFDGMLLAKSAFVIRRVDASAKATASPPAKLSAAEQQRVQGGGLSGLRDVLDSGAIAPNVQRLLYAGKLRFGDFSNWPWLELVKGMAAWTPRRLRR